MARKKQIRVTSWRFWLPVSTVLVTFASQRVDQFAGERKEWRRVSAGLKITGAALTGISTFVGLVDRLKSVGGRAEEPEEVETGYRKRLKKGMRKQVKAVKTAGAELVEASESAVGYAGAAASRAASAVRPAVEDVAERLEAVPERLGEAAATTAKGAGGAMRTLAWVAILGSIIFIVYEPDARRRQAILSRGWSMMRGAWVFTRRRP